jgi:ferredoxin
MKLLKPLRVTVSVALLVLVTALYLDFGNRVPPSFARSLLNLQFVPSLMRLLDTAAFSAAGFAGILVLTIFCGRVYCSTVCPLGTFQDLVGYAARMHKRRRSFSYTPPQNGLRYALLVIVTLLLLAGNSLPLNLLDPYSGFGRILANLVRPVVLVANNLGAGVLEHFGLYTISRKQGAVMSGAAVAVSLALLLVTGFLAARCGRLYCNTVCPVGTLLGLVSQIALAGIRVAREKCTGCRRCEQACKAGCIDLAAMTVDSSRCVACYNCLTVCADGAMHLGNRWRLGHASAGPDRGRRDFLYCSGLYLLGLTGLAEPPRRIVQAKPTTIPEAVTCPVSPPGSLNIARFTSICTACHLCVGSCPSRVLVSSLLEFGLSGIMLPRLNFRAAHCNYECTICMDICPTGALVPLTIEEKKLTQTGTSRFIKENCVVFTDNTACGACSEHCPTKAVSMVPYQNPLNKPLLIPEVNNDYCVGCGGCEHACPTKPYKAIYVDGHPVHKRARKPVIQKIQEETGGKAEFPF